MEWQAETPRPDVMLYARHEAEIPARPGAYVLVVELTEPVLSLSPGRYLYCGSAKGPGGLRARIARHMRRGKSLHWHIDRLTETGQVLGCWVAVGGDECTLARQLQGFPVPIPGFGSSDCQTCSSHLLSWPSGMNLPWEG